MDGNARVTNRVKGTIMIKKLICKLFTYLRTTVYPSVTIYLLIVYFNWDIAWIEKQSNVFSRIAFVVILSLVWWVYDEKEEE